MAGMAGVVVSVNVAVVRDNPWTRVDSRETGIDKRPVHGAVLLDSAGVAGDTICDLKNHGGPDQAVYAYAAEDLEFWSAELGHEVPAGGVGENLTVSGVDCTAAVVGEIWRVGGAVLQVRAPRIPCRVFAGFRDVPDLVKRFTAALRPGAYLGVLQPGEVRAGDVVLVEDRPAHGVTTADVMAAKSGARDRLDRLMDARLDLGARERAWLDRVLAAIR